MIHNQNQGNLHKKNTEQMAEEIQILAELEPEDVLTESRFLLEMNLGDLTKLHAKTQTYWITAVTAARSAKARKSAMGAREKRSKKKHLGNTSIRIKLGIVEVERQITRDRIQNRLGGNCTTFYKETDQSVLDKFIVKWPHS